MPINYEKLLIIGSLSAVSSVIIAICVRRLKKSKYLGEIEASVADSASADTDSKEAEAINNSEDENNDPDDPVNEVLFFPDKGFPCKQFLFGKFGCQRQNCSYLHNETSLSKLCKYLNYSKKSIDACLFILTNKDLTDCLIKACKRGVQVRLLIDSTMAQSEGRRLKELSDNGAFICEAVTNYLVHHKFAVVDRELLLTGSYNWTAQATLGNWDNVLITSACSLVTPYAVQFDELWKDFSEDEAPLPPIAQNYPFLRKSAWEGIIIGHEAPK